MTKTARPFAEVRAALTTCRAENTGWPTRESGIVLRRAEKAYADAAQTPGEIREVLADLRQQQKALTLKGKQPTKTRTTLIGGLYERLAIAVEAAIAAEQAEAAARIALAAECEARIEAARAAAPAKTKLASGMEVETRLILSITGKPGDQWAMVQGLQGKHPIHDADAAPVRQMFHTQMNAVMDCRTPAQQAEIDAQIEAAEDAEAERIDLAAKAARLAELAAPTPPSPTFQALTAAKQALDTASYHASHKPWSREAAAELTRAQVAFDAAIQADREAGRAKAVAAYVAEPTNANAAALDATRPATEAASLDDLLGMVREAAERGDWTQVHEYALDIASIADGNINGGA